MQSERAWLVVRLALLTTSMTAEVSEMIQQDRMFLMLHRASSSLLQIIAHCVEREVNGEGKRCERSVRRACDEAETKGSFMRLENGVEAREVIVCVFKFFFPFTCVVDCDFAGRLRRCLHGDIVAL